MKRFTEIFAAGFIAFVLLALASCGESAGLGSTVDTEAPKLSIEYPPAAAAVKGTFVFAGTCSDDKGISRVEVSIKNLDTGVSYGKSLANVNNSLTWELSVNKENDSGFDLPDGKYQFEAIAYDKSGRSSGVSSRQFDIDNTPPVFVITKPGVDRKAFVSNGSLSKYGSLFTIDGTIADDHSIATMDVTVYDKNGNLVSTDPYSEQEISTTGGTSVTIARYIADGQDEVNKRYKEIYDYSEDADSSGNKIYSCTITIADSTKEYKNPGDSGSEGGNSTSVVYLYDDVYEDYMSAKKGAGLSVNDFRSVLNGTASDDSIKGKGLKDFSVNQVRTALANFAKDTTKIEDNSLSFSLNPNADPTYNISGFNLNYNDAGTAIAAGTNKAMGEQPLTIIVSAGLDQVNIDPKSLKVYIKKIIDADKAHITKKALNNSIADLVTKVSELEINLSNAVESSNSDAQKEAEAQLSVIDGWKLLLDNSKDTSSSDKTVTLSTSLPASNYIEANAYYAIVVTGCDKDGVKLSQSKNYGFMGTVSAVPPSANFTSPKELSYFANSKYSEGSETDKLVFTGTATENNAGMTLREITATLTVSDESTGQKVPGSIQVTITGDADNKWTEDGGLSCVYDEQTHTNLWTFIPSLCGKAYQEIMAEAEGLMYMYTVNIKVTGTSALTYEMTRSVHIDTTKPVVRITSVTPVVSGAEYFGAGDENTYINGSVSLKGSIEEPNLTEVKYDIWASTDLEKTLTAEDSILNELKTFTEGKINGSLGRIYTINQEIDTELITKFFISKEKIEKDQPIQAKIVVTAIDTVGNEGNYSSSDSNDGKDLIIYQETNRPKITLGNADSKITEKSGINVNSNLFGTTNNNKLSISVSDDDYIASYEIFICKEDDEFATEANRIETPKKTSAALNYVLPEEEGVYKVKVVARDFIASEINTDQNNPTGIMTVGPFLIAVDSGAPTLNLSNPQNGTFVSRANGIDGGVKGTVSKREGTTITGFVYKSGDKDKKPLVNLETVVINKEAVNEVYDWSGIINKMPEKEQGESFKLEITATDIYGQYSIVTVNLGIDETAPTITLNADGEIVDGEGKVKTGARIIETNPNYSVKDGVNRYLVSGTWCDEYKEGTGDEARIVQGTGTSELYCAYATELENNQPKWIYLNGTETVTIGETTKEVPLPIPGTAKSTAETSFNIYIPLTECGNFAYKIWGKDVAGNVTEPVVYSGISVDLGAPKITKTSGDLPKYVKKGETLTIAGSYEDSYGIKTLAVKALFKPFGETDFAEVTTGQHGYTLADTRAEDGKSGSFSITVNPASLKSEGEWKFDLTVTDLADRTASITNLSTIVDTVAPKGLHAMDKSNKDLYFRVGSNNNDDISSSDSSWVPAKDEDVGGKYSENTYGNANTIKIRGNFKDDGTGLSMIYYKVISSPSALDYDTLKGHANSFLANYSQSNDLGYTGYFAPLAADKIETKRVFFTSDNGKIAERTLDEDGNGTDLTDEAGNKVYFLESSEFIVNSKGETKYYTEIESNYDSVLSGFTEGINYLILVAVDNAGNAALDSVIADKEYLNASINVDTQVPEASGDDLGIKYTNGSANSTTEIKGKATDAAAGVRDIVISVNNKQINIGDTLENTETYGSLTIDSKTVVNGLSTWTWTAVLKNDKIFAGLAANTASKTFSVTATVTDNAGAGNSQSYGVASIIADNKVPTVELKTPTDADKTTAIVIDINKTISLSGNVEDANPLPENEDNTDKTSNTITAIQYTTDENASADDDTGWISITNAANGHEGMADFKITGNYSFDVTGLDTLATVTVNETPAARFTDNSTYYLRAKAVDKAGNTGYSNVVPVYVNQRSDRPVLNFTNLTKNAAGEFILKLNDSGTVECTVTDDDSTNSAIVKSITIQEFDKEGAAIGSERNVTISSSGDFTFTPATNDDGSKYFKFSVVDNKNTVFTSYSSTSDYTNIPVLRVKGEQLQETSIASQAFSYKSDNEAPVIESVKAKASDINGTAETNESLISAAYIVGGTKRASVVITINASDANGIAGMTAVIKKPDGTVFQSYKSTTESKLAGKDLPTTSTWTKAGTFTNPEYEKGKWELPSLNTSELGEGTVSIVITPYDNSGLTGNSTQMFTVDITGPSVSVSSHKNANSSSINYDATGTQYNGIIKLGGIANDTNAVSSVKWYIPSESDRTNWSTLTKENLAWNGDITNAAFNFEFSGTTLLDGYTANASSNGTDSTSNTNWYIIPIYFRAVDEYGNIGYSTDYAIKFNPDLDKPKSEIAYPTTSTIEGQTTTLGGTIRMNGTAIIPDGSQTGLSVHSVYIQIGASEAFGTTDKTKAGTGTGNYGYKVVSAYDVIAEVAGIEYASTATTGKTLMTDEIAKRYGFTGKTQLEAWWGIKTTTTGWRLNLNENGEMNPSSDTETNKVYLRVSAVNTNTKFGAWSESQYIAISKSAPAMSGKLYQFTNDPSSSNVTTVTTGSNVIGEREYTSGMFVKGQWYIETTATETASGTNVTIEGVTKNGDPLTKGTEYFVTADKAATIKVYIPVDQTATSETVYKVTAIDGTGLYSAVDTYRINVDITPPTLGALCSDYNKTNEISMTKIENSNYKYDIYSSAVENENGSGLDFIALYFKRGSTIEIPLPKINSSDEQETKAQAGTAYTGTLSPLSSEATYTEADKVLYGVSGSVTCTSADGVTTITAASLITAANSFIRKGSLVKLSGSYYVLTSVNTTNHTATVNTTFGTAPTTAFFAAAIAIDKSGEGASISSGIMTITKDDGDGFLEDFSTSGTTTAWQLEFFSDELNDGEIEIVVVAADKAGNYVNNSTTVMLTNHKPRVSKVFLATDLSGNGTYDEEDFAYTVTNNRVSSTVYAYSALTDDGKEQEVVNLNTGKFSVRNGLAVTFEMLGAINGNAARTGSGSELYYIPKLLTSSAATDTAKQTPAVGSTSTKLVDMAGTTSGKINVTANTEKVASTKGFVLSNDEIKQTTAGKSIGWIDSMENSTELNTPSVVQVTIWDDVKKTAVVGSNSTSITGSVDTTDTNGKITAFGNQYTIVNIPVYFDMTDGNKPKTVIDPFYWRSASDNSVYGGNPSNGHIELESDLTGTAAATLYGSDPKVSGKITLEGYAYDDQRLSSLWVAFDGFTPPSTTNSATYLNIGPDANATVNSVTAVSGTYANSTDRKIYYQAAFYTPSTGKWTAATSVIGWDSTENKVETTYRTNQTTQEEVKTSMANDGWEFSVTYATDNANEVYLSQKGHKVKWTLSIDTEKCSPIVAQNVKARVIAFDHKQNIVSLAESDITSTLTNTDGSDNVPLYQMDVVPYITGISTDERKASGLKENNIRSASGKYSILANRTVNGVDNDITVKGFNFSTATNELVARLVTETNKNETTSPIASGDASATGNIKLSITASDTQTATIDNGSSAGISSSGYLELFSTGIRALNNINNNDAHGSFTRTSSADDYKLMPNRVNEADFYTTKNVTLTDDRYLRFFDMRDTGVENAYYPVMTMIGSDGKRGVNPVFGYVDNNGGPSTNVGTTAGTGAGTWRASNAQAQRAQFSGTELSNGKAKEIYTEYIVKQLATEQMGMAVDAGGRYYNVTLFNYDGGGFTLYYDRYNELNPGTLGYYDNNIGGYTYTGNCWGPGNSYVDYKGSFSYGTNNNAIVLETTNYNNALKLNRYEYPKIITDGNSITGNAVVYMSYFDSKTSEIIFRNFIVGKSLTNGTKLDSSGKDNNGKTYAQSYNFTENTSNSNAWKSGRLSVSTTGSKYFDMGVTSDGHVVIVYVDSSTNKLKLKYSTNPVDGSSPTTNVAWTTSKVTFPANVGTYVSMALDGNAVHIAAFDSYDSNLVYMYMENYDDESLTSSITVDQASAVGNWTQVKVKDGVPYIAYYNSTETGGRDCIKLAYPVATTGATEAENKTAAQNKEVAGVNVMPGSAYGTDGKTAATGYTTGAWEYMTVPALTPPQGGDPKFQNVCLDFDSNGIPVVGYLGTNLEFGKWLTE